MERSSDDEWHGYYYGQLSGPHGERTSEGGHSERAEAEPSTSTAPPRPPPPPAASRSDWQHLFNMLDCHQTQVVERLDRVDARLDTFDVRLCRMEDHFGIASSLHPTPWTSGDDRESVGASKGGVGPAFWVAPYVFASMFSMSFLFFSYVGYNWLSLLHLIFGQC